jgi:tetratricopeptide (TPR) repeat protein
MLYFAALLVAVQLTASPGPPNEVSDALTRAQALYYEAKFKDSADLLLRVDEMLRPRPDRLQEKINVKLQLALDYIGMNDAVKAKSLLRELYALDPDYVIDAQQFSPKVLGLATEARTEQSEVRCQTTRDDVRKKLDAGNPRPVLELIGSMKSKCTGLTAFEPELAELFYKAGFESYKRGELSNALQNFQAALRLSPKHELANQYTDLTQSKLQVNADRLFIQWQRNFDSREFVQAAADYRHLVSFNDEANTQLIAQARTEYRKALTGFVETWNRSCMAGDTATMNTVRAQISELLPEPSFSEDIREKMTTCTKTGCLQMNTTLAMARVKSRVNPDLTPALQNFIRGTQLTVRVKARIDEAGNVTVSDVQGTNPSVNSAVRSAVERWKFSPIIDQNGSRCVDTEIPIVIGTSGAAAARP